MTPPDQEPSALADVVGAKLTLATLLVDFPAYARTYVSILRSPTVQFRGAAARSESGFKPAIAFMLQGITLGFVILTAGWALPQLLASFIAFTSIGASYDVFAARSRAIRGVLPPALATDWFNQSELVLITRQLPEQRFRLVLERLRDLSEKEPEVLELVVKGPSARERRITSPARIMEFFMTLAPGAGAKFHTADLAMAQWSKYRLQPHVEYLVRNLLFWYVACLVVWACMPRTRTPSYTRKTAFTVGAYVLGFLAPILEATAIPTTISNVTRLPIFLDKLSACFLEEIGCVVADVMLAGTTWSRMVTMEILEDVPIVIGLVVLWIGVRRVYRVAPLRVVLAVLAAVLVAWGATEAGVMIAAKLLVPTGLV